MSRNRCQESAPASEVASTSPRMAQVSAITSVIVTSGRKVPAVRARAVSSSSAARILRALASSVRR
jgi:hypothetical protein